MAYVIVFKAPFVKNVNNLNKIKLLQYLRALMNKTSNELHIWEHKNGLGQIIKTKTNTK